MQRPVITLLLTIPLAAAGCTSGRSAPAPEATLTWPSDPALTLRFAAPFRPLAPLRFPIEDLTDAERHIFVDADASGLVQRAAIVQFERVQAGSSFRFVYPSTPPHRFGRETYRRGAFAYDDAQAAEENPDREAGRTRAHLLANDLEPPRTWKVARLARVSDSQGLSEVIVFYMENGDGDYPADEPYPVDADGDLLLEEAEADRLLEALERNITVVAG